jgi:hypothetical protein
LRNEPRTRDLIEAKPGVAGGGPPRGPPFSRVDSIVMLASTSISEQELASRKLHDLVTARNEGKARGIQFMVRI